jgi:hypothetical protein
MHADALEHADQVGVGVDAVQPAGGLQALAEPDRERRWTAVAGLEAVIAMASIGEAASGAWCREQGLFTSGLVRRRVSAAAALEEPEEGCRGIGVRFIEAGNPESAQPTLPLAEIPEESVRWPSRLGAAGADTVRPKLGQTAARRSVGEKG